MNILAMNCGSSTLKAALYRAGGHEEQLVLTAAIDRIGTTGGRFSVTDAHNRVLVERDLEVNEHERAARELLDWLADHSDTRDIDAIGHRVVHGGAQYTSPCRITGKLMRALEELVPVVPDHLPAELAVIRAVQQRRPELPQIACFDTAFHRTMPRRAREYALPRWARDIGVRRYGFHGLSYEYVMSRLAAEHNAETARQRIVIAHLGSGASMVALRDGRPVDTTMGLTPTGGLVMSTRSGDLDPGVLLYLMDRQNLDAPAINALVNHEAGLLGRSGSTADMKDLVQRAVHDDDADAAIELFCYQAKKFLGALVAVLGGLDVLVFTGGIGAHAPPVRQRICTGLEFLGVNIEQDRNSANASVISAEGNATVVRVIETNEQLMIARHTHEILLEGNGARNERHIRDHQGAARRSAG